MPIFLTLAGAALACVIYGVFEARLYRIRNYVVPVLSAGAKPIRILQVSDLHLRRSNRRLIAFLRNLPDVSYDLVLATGDLLGEADVMELCAELLNGLKADRRYFVFGSSDYYAPRLRSYTGYFFKIRRPGAKKNPADLFAHALVNAGWTDLNNATDFEDGVQITGLDDPHLKRDDLRLLVRKPAAQLAVCVVHDPTPYLDALSAGFDLVVAGHTHGGQVRLPLIGAVVTNSTLPVRYARGLHRIKGGWLFVSPGLGTNKFAPFRFLCRPEASILNLVPGGGGGVRGSSSRQSV